MTGVYLAGPMRGHPQFNFPAFFSAEEWLADNFHRPSTIIFNPARRDESLGFLARAWDLTGHEDLDQPILYCPWPEDHDAPGAEGTPETCSLKKSYQFDLAAAMEADNEFIRSDECTHIVMLPDWGSSVGAVAEYDLAVSLGREVLFLRNGVAGWYLGEAYAFDYDNSHTTRHETKEADMQLSHEPIDYHRDNLDAAGIPRNAWIGLAGPARAGKDTVGGYLVERYGFTRVSFADPVRAMALAIDPIIGVEGFAGGLDVRRPTRLSELVERSGWEMAKESAEVRGLLQRIGTEAVRNIVGEKTWVELAMRTAEAIDGPVVFTDVRFENEVAAIESNGGEVIRVVRETAAVRAHVSESALDGVPLVRLDNTGPIEDLSAKVDAILFVLADYLKRG